MIGLYRVPRQPLTAEQTLGALEEDAKAVLDRIACERALPQSGSGDRDTLALYMGVQLARDPDHVLRFEFAHDVIAAIGHPPIDHWAMREYLEQRVLGFEPHEDRSPGCL